MAVAVIESDRITSLGARSEELFQAGSIAKCTTAYLALRLVGDGVLELDSPVNRSLRSWRIPDGDAVTLRQLLTHTAGIGVPFFPGYERTDKLPTMAQVLDGLPPTNTAAVRVETAAGDFRYSGGGYVIVQQLIEDVTKLAFERIAHNLVFRPLAMTNSTFVQSLPANLARRVAREDWHVYPEKSAAGLWTTPQDLAKFVSAIQKAAADRPSALATDIARRMIMPSVGLPPKATGRPLARSVCESAITTGQASSSRATSNFSAILAEPTASSRS